MQNLVPGLFNILECMVCEEPEGRLTMAKASDMLAEWRIGVHDIITGIPVALYRPY
jgi:hypothetical protein